MPFLNTGFISSIHKDYKCVSQSVPDQEANNFCYPRLLRGHGGVAILWHKLYDQYISPVLYPYSERIIGIRLHCQPSDIIIFSVYLPSRSGATDPFRDSLDVIDSALNTYTDCITIVMGDFNADPGTKTSPPMSKAKFLKTIYQNGPTFPPICICPTKQMSTLMRVKPTILPQLLTISFALCLFCLWLETLMLAPIIL